MDTWVDKHKPKCLDDIIMHDGIREMLETDEPFLLEVIVPYTEHVLPMIPQGKSAKEILIDQYLYGVKIVSSGLSN